MAIQNRIITCDVCGTEHEELDFQTGWEGWCIINGIGAEAPKHGQPIRKRNLETCLCPECREGVSNFINGLQEAHAESKD